MEKLRLEPLIFRLFISCDLHVSSRRRMMLMCFWDSATLINMMIGSFQQLTTSFFQIHMCATEQMWYTPEIKQGTPKKMGDL